MNKIKKIGAVIIIFIFNFYNVCFADLMGGGSLLPSIPKKQDTPIKPATSGGTSGDIVNYIRIGIFVLIIVVCTIFIIRKIIKNKKEALNDK